MNHSSIKVILISLICAFCGSAHSESLSECGSLQNAYGPFDYTNYNHFTEKLPVVDRNHFTTNIETLQSGNHGVLPGNDLDYTLRAFPNHHRALYSVAMYGVQQNSPKPRGLSYSIECFFQRAMRFKPEDDRVRLIFGIYLNKIGKVEEAIDQVNYALELNPDSIEAHYNLGLMYVALKDFDSALHHAEIAYSYGFPLSGLRIKLEKAGVWK